MNKNNNLLTKVNPKNLPNHVAVIMDGNRRWAEKKGLSKHFGYKQAIQAIKNAIEATRDLSIQYLTLYAFSTENWNRPKIEINNILSLLLATISKEIDLFIQQNVCFRTIGDISKFSKKIQQKIELLTQTTKNATNGNLIIALNYGSRSEIVFAFESIYNKIKKNELTINEINEFTINNHLYTKNIPDVDLLIRTSGEKRISNFLLWQVAYAELYFTDVLWPDFSKEDFFQAVINYQSRERRFGTTNKKIISN